MYFDRHAVRRVKWGRIYMTIGLILLLYSIPQISNFINSSGPAVKATEKNVSITETMNQAPSWIGSLMSRCTEKYPLATAALLLGFPSVVIVSCVKLIAANKNS